LVPKAALLQAAEHFLKVERFDPTQVFETRLELKAAEASHRPSLLTLYGFIDSVAAGTPTPGGGSVAALAGSLAAALGLMACRVSRMTKEAAAAGTPFAEESKLADLSEQLREIIQADADAFEGVLAAYRIPKTDPGRPQAITTALEQATESPLRTATLAGETLQLLRGLQGKAKPSVGSDLDVGLLMAQVAIQGGLANVDVNIKSLKNQDFATRVSRQVEQIKRILEEPKPLW
jgi:glutamate formiminotransferase/formiminotetrahydrofolate cyclodeaminase